MIELPIEDTGSNYALHPTKIVCLGRNYRAHAKEFGNEPPTEPLFFVKTPTCLIPHGAPIILPPPDLCIKRVDHEIELAVIIKHSCKNVPSNEVMERLEGFTVFNDITARDLQREDISNKRPWFRSKNLDTFGPIGPRLVPAGSIDPGNLDLTLKVNGELRQHANTAAMVFKIPEQVAFISRYMTLEPGDIIATGTPHGVGPLANGDVVDATIDGIGTLENPVTASR
ncbi:acylpyruvase [Candidatus Bathyarchaeota archaeon]|nr:acylpyruvase [Candidatus Bathyarchaeota archaeon]